MTPDPGRQPEPIHIRRAQAADLARIVAIEECSFATPWPEADLAAEIAGVARGVYLVAESAGEVVGYIGMWFVVGEAHIGTLAVLPERRGEGTGEALLLALLEYALAHGGNFVTLEYRISNLPAAGLYGKYGFTPTRVRKGYYTDTGEDAVEVVMRDLATREGRARISVLKQKWLQKHPGGLSVAV
jgi:[ribosomal protein S18]-alanine N-acetyltransferase